MRVLLVVAVYRRVLQVEQRLEKNGLERRQNQTVRGHFEQLVAVAEGYGQDEGGIWQDGRCKDKSRGGCVAVIVLVVVSVFMNRSMLNRFEQRRGCMDMWLDRQLGETRRR